MPAPPHPPSLLNERFRATLKVLLVPAIFISLTAAAQAQTTFPDYKSAYIAATTKSAEAEAAFKLVLGSWESVLALEKAQQDRAKAAWLTHFAGNAANKATRLAKTKAIGDATAIALADLKSASTQLKSAVSALKSSHSEVSSATPDWGAGLANANLANLKFSATLDYCQFANTELLNTASKIGEYKAWLDSILMLV